MTYMHNISLALHSAKEYVQGFTAGKIALIIKQCHTSPACREHLHILTITGQTLCGTQNEDSGQLWSTTFS